MFSFRINFEITILKRFLDVVTFQSFSHHFRKFTTQTIEKIWHLCGSETLKRISH